MEWNWKKEWVLPFESSWSILEKVKFSNNINTKQLLQYFGDSQPKIHRKNSRYVSILLK